ncbi:caspase family protein [Kamptonema animale CS-326]|jgi:WD40 repeat protein|uniref:nSTAND1 domain-containing NTPase n=1 Tax=Kamptonema animale TaxID=92934 RepID=UPI00232B5AE3|nr:caspase family protein [Kamptonema animale]MDB9511649.1 caspase family protein [Kamptonema animale CS-326]
MEFKRSLAIVLGINDYQNGISPLRTATNDAKELARILKEDHNYDVKLLLDTEVTREKLQILLLEALPKEVGENDRILFYFAGHGIALDNDDGPAGYVIPQDAQPGDSSTFVPMQQVHDAIASLPCRHLLAILDCCFAGAFRWAATRDLLAYPEVIHQERYDRFIKDPAWVAITSASHDQKALDSLSLKDDRGISGNHSPFAEALFEGLRGRADLFPPPKDGQPSGDGVITATELFLYVRDRVEPDSAEQRHRQTPGMWPLAKHDKGEFIFLVPGHELNLPPAPELNRENNPYRGLESFDEEHSNLFFGREKLIKKLYKFVEKHPLTVVLGASGTGKSSLVKAGLIPRWRNANSTVEAKSRAITTSEGGGETDNSSVVTVIGPLRPGESPLTSLARAVVLIDENISSRQGTDNEKQINDILRIQQLTEELRQNLSKFADLVTIWSSANPQKKLLLVVDQFEELVTMSDEEERSLFLAQLESAIAAHPEALRVAIAVRLDFEAQFLDSALKAYWIDGRFVVPPMTQDELRQAIEGPASERVLYFEPSSLTDQLINEVVQMPGALPLLSFTLSELYIKYLESRRNNRALSENDYKQLGGVAGSLTQRATAEYDQLVQLDSAYHDTVRRVMLRMVAVEGGELARRRVARSELVYTNSSENQRVSEVIRRFSAARLLVGGQETGGEAYVEPAHDAIARGWDKLQRWKNQEQETLTLQRLLTPAAKEWVNNKQVGFLWNNNPRLDLLEQVLTSDDNWLNQYESEFIKRSIQRRRNNRLRVIAAVSTFVTVVSLSAIIALIQRNRAIENQIDALASLSESQLLSNQQLDALLAGMKAGKQLKTAMNVSGNVAMETVGSLQQAIDNGKEDNRLEGHGDRVQAVKYSPDGKTIATASSDKTIKLWSVDGRLLQTLTGNERSVNDLSFSPDGKLLAAASSDGIVKLWNIANGDITGGFISQSIQIQRFSILPEISQELKFVANSESRLKPTSNSSSVLFRGLQLLGGDFNPRRVIATTLQPIKTFTGHNEKVNSISFSPDGKMLATASDDKTIKLWNLDGSLIKTFTGHAERVTRISWSSDSKNIASVSEDKTLRLWKINSNKSKICKGHTDYIMDVSFSPDGKMLATASLDKTVKIWQPDCKIMANFAEQEKGAISVSFSANGKMLASGSDDYTARVWSLEPGGAGEILLNQFKGHGDQVTSVNFSPDGNNLATASADKTVKIWRLDGGIPLRHDGFVESVSFNPDGKTFASASADGQVKLWRTADKTILHTIKLDSSNKVSSISFSPDGKILAAGSYDKTVQLWNAADGTPLKNLAAHSEGVTSVAFSPNGKILASGSDDKTIKLWNVAEGKLQKNITEHSDGVTSLAFSSDGKFLASGSNDKTVKLFNSDGTLVKTLEGHSQAVQAVAWHPNSKILASASADNTIKLWNADSGKEIRTLTGHQNAVVSVSFSPDGKILASGSADNTIKLWNAVDGTLIKTLIGHQAQVKSVGFSPDGKILVSGSYDQTISLSSLDLDDLLRRGCDRLQDYLTNNVNLKESDRNICKYSNPK